MNIVFMGTPEFAVKSLDKLIEKGYRVNTVITQPDRPRGRGNVVQASPVKSRALENNISVVQPERIRTPGVIRALKDLNPDIIIVVAYGQLLPKEIIELPKFGCINVHASLLPKYRGAAPINWCIIKGENISGVTTMYMDEGMDTGDILLSQHTPIGDHETAGQLHDRLGDIGAELLIQTIEGIKRDNLCRKVQDHGAATYAPPLNRNTGKVDWKGSAQDIYNLIRGTNPWPGCYTCYGEQRMKLWDARVSDSTSEGTPGKVVEIVPKGLSVQTGKGKLLIMEIQMPSSKRMAMKEYLKGNPIKLGSVLGE